MEKIELFALHKRTNNKGEIHVKKMCKMLLIVFILMILNLNFSPALLV
jgi:hypothetical protein